MSELQQAYDLEDYEDFINKEIFSGKPLAEYVAEVQRIYMGDKRPWVIGYSGGKDSTAVVTLVHLALMGLEPEDRHKPVFVVSSDTLVETPVVVDHITRSLDLIGKSAKLNNLPITSHKVVPQAKESFWACLLGKGYPAPTKSFRWCTERMKIDPVSSFIKDKVSQYDEVIVLLGSRSDESASRAQVIAKHKIDGTRLARHTTLANAFIYTPIDTWDVNDVWNIIRGAFRYAEHDIEEWENPWGGNNRPLWTLYMDSSDQGECPLVIDDSTPSCGNSRFGCWTCTVVSKDRAMESLIKNGEEWMKPLLVFRDKLAFTSIPENKDQFRNYKRRIGKVNFQRAKDGQEISEERAHVPGPYWLKYRKEWLKELLVQEKQFNEDGHTIVLITEPELHAIRQEWLNDPNEPDWNDSLPQLYRDVYEKDLDWVINDNSTFDNKGAQILSQLGAEHDIAPEMVMKLLDLEISMEGLSRRTGVQNKIGTILKQDWGTLEQIKEKQEGMQSKAAYDVFQEEIEALDSKLAEIDKLMSEEF